METLYKLPESPKDIVNFERVEVVRGTVEMAFSHLDPEGLVVAEEVHCSPGSEFHQHGMLAEKTLSKNYLNCLK